MNAFGQMVTQLSVDAFRDTEFNKINKYEYDLFLKEFVFDKLKGIKLGEAFSKKFKVGDRVLYMYSDDTDTKRHIEQWYINK